MNSNISCKENSALSTEQYTVYIDNFTFGQTRPSYVVSVEVEQPEATSFVGLQVNAKPGVRTSVVYTVEPIW